MPSRNDFICQSVFEYFEARILMGRYPTGGKLPTILEIAAAFHLAPETVRSALLMLAERGYIRTEAKLGSWVIYQADQETQAKNNALYFAQRHDGICDLFRSGLYLLEPLLSHAMQQMDDGCWARLRAFWANPQKDPIIPTSIQFYAQVLSTLNSSLILNLYWEINRYVRFSYLPDWDAYDVVVPALLENDREKAAVLIQAALRSAGRDTGTQLLSVCVEARALYPTEAPIPFHWTVYRQRRQLCYTLAARIIRMIAAGDYPVGTYLPSLPTMAERLDVSLHTLRRTLSILGSLGVTRSFHGKGTLVCRRVENIEFSRNEIKEGLRYHWESLQFLSLTAKSVSFYMMQTIPQADQKSLTEQFVEMCRLDQCYRCFDIVLNFIIQRCPLETVRTCYGTLQEYLAWGYPFTVYRLQNRSLQSQYVETIRRAADQLLRQDWAGFSEEFGALMAHEAQRVERILTDYCK